VGDIIYKLKSKQEKTDQINQDYHDNKAKDSKHNTRSESINLDDFITIVTAENIDSISKEYSAFDIVIPLVGFNTIMNPNLLHEFDGLLKEYELSLDMFKGSNLKGD